MHDGGGSRAVCRVSGNNLSGVEGGGVGILGRSTGHKSSGDSGDGETHVDDSSTVSRNDLSFLTWGQRTDGGVDGDPMRRDEQHKKE